MPTGADKRQKLKLLDEEIAVKVGASGSVVVLTTTASRMAVSDPTWWSFGP